MKIPFACFFVAVAALFNTSAFSTQYLLDATDDPEAIAAKLQPGDEIVLMPGEHSGFKLKNVVGTREKPIVIRGLDAKQPGPIRAQKNFYGIHLVGCSFVEVKDVFVFGAQYVGIFVEGNSVDAVQEANIRITRSVVAQTGRLGGDRDAIRLHGVGEVTIEDCRIEGWTDSAIDVVASSHVNIERCTLRHRDGFFTEAGVTVRAGSKNVRVTSTRFDTAGNVAVAIGGISPNVDFRPRLSDDAGAGTTFEATDVTVEKCFFNLGKVPVSLIHASNVSFVKNTVKSAKRSVMLATRSTKDPRFAPTRNVTFGWNLITWTPSNVTKIGDFDDTIDVNSIKMESNLWWSEELPDALEVIGPIPGDGKAPQTLDVDPKLDSEMKPTDPRAATFGAFAP